MTVERSDHEAFIHEKAICDSPNVGRGTRIWAFAHVLSGARIGRDCNICDHVFIENDVIIGDEVTLSFKNGFLNGDVNGDGKADFKIYIPDHHLTSDNLVL